MAAMKPRTGDGPLEATKEGRGIVMRVPLEGGGRLVVELTPEEAAALGDELKGVHQLASRGQDAHLAVDLEGLLGDASPRELVDAPLPTARPNRSRPLRIGTNELTASANRVRTPQRRRRS